MTVDKKLFKGNLYICETIPYVIEDDVTDVGYVFVPQDSFNGYKELNPTLNKLYPYNYRAINVGTTNKELYEALTVAISTETNAPVMQVMYSKGLCDNPNYMTIAECGAVTNEQIDNLFENNTEIVSFMEFQYFTGCTKTGLNMFLNCPNIERVELPKTITVIDKKFLGGVYSQDYNQKNKIRYVGGCENVEEMAHNSFQNVDCLEYINFTEKLKRTAKIYSAFPSKGEDYKPVLKSMGNLSGVEELASSAFYGEASLEDVDLSNIKTIPYAAFYISSIKPKLNWKNITTIGDYACTTTETYKDYSANIEYITDAENLTTIGNYAFNWNLHLKEIRDLPSLVSMGTSAFNHCQNLKRIGNLPNLETFGEYAIWSCPNLEYVGDMPKVTVFARFVFEMCTNLKTIGDVSSLTRISGRTFGRCYSFNKYFPAVTRIDDYAFCMNTYNDPLEKPRVIEFATPYDQMTFGRNPFMACTMTTIIMGGVELTDEQYTALGATKPVK